jgi:predicted DNA-binding transcriptional regulator YafY
VGARLVAGLLPPVELTQEERTARAAAARVWLASLALPAPVRAPLAKLFDATRAALPSQTASALVTVADAAASYLDGPALAELRALAAQLA